jgi:hypothetical protein
MIDECNYILKLLYKDLDNLISIRDRVIKKETWQEKIDYVKKIIIKYERLKGDN